MSITYGHINLDGCGGGAWIEVAVQWDYEPGYPATRIDPEEPEGAENIRVIGWRWPKQDVWTTPDKHMEQVLCECVTVDWLLTEGDRDDYPNAWRDAAE
jgi:hypothetical protein